jgi:4a-hydroxytetrahydrobiopterin dehydratase
MNYKEQNNQLILELKPLNYLQGLEWVNRAALLAEEQNHHPDIVFSYSKITVSINSHDAGHKVTEKDRNYMKELEKRIIK